LDAPPPTIRYPDEEDFKMAVAENIMIISEIFKMIVMALFVMKAGGNIDHTIIQFFGQRTGF
jgi:hypothetical protein